MESLWLGNGSVGGLGVVGLFSICVAAHVTGLCFVLLVCVFVWLCVGICQVVFGL